MKKVIVIGIALVLGLLLLPACAGGGVSQAEYDKISSDLATAQTQIQSLQADLATAQAEVQSLQGDLAAAQAQVQSLQATAGANAAETLAYAEFLDVLMSPDYKKVAIIPRFDFANELAWLAELENRATDLGDTRLSDYIEAMQKGSAAAKPSAWDYCLGIIEENSQ